MQWISLFILSLLLSFSSFPSVSWSKEASEERPHCPVCGMFADTDLKWQAEIQFKDGTNVLFESPKHAFEYYLKLPQYTKNSRKKNDIKAFLVHDYLSGKRVEARDSHFLVGSQIMGPMGPDILPVPHKKIPEFQKKYGGEHLHFSDITLKILKGIEEISSEKMHQEHTH